MPILLHLDSSPLESSVSRELGREFVSNWKSVHANETVIYRDLAALPSKPVNQAFIHAVYTPDEAKTAEQKAILASSDELIAELFTADEYVFGVAMHNFSIPSTLKLWIDQISRKDKTFAYGEFGPKGLLADKKATILIASGGVYDADTPMAAYNFVEPYLKTILGFLGVTDVTFLTAGGTQALNYGKVDRETFLAPTLERVRELVA
jgi:FMN-dependent NADH-azoreductase